MQRPAVRFIHAVTLIAYLLPACGCDGFRRVDRKVHRGEDFRAMSAADANELSRGSPYLKVHMRGGNLYVLSKWESRADSALVTGDGFLYGPARNELGAGRFTVGVDSVALFETNVVSLSPVAGIFAFAAVLTVGLAIYCLTHEKACFGSCPTFYVAGVDSLRPRAEAFSASIAPSLEASDVADLARHARGGEGVSLEMRNEAYETHVVRRVDVLALPAPPGRRALADEDGRFWSAGEMIRPRAARGSEGDCLDLVACSDRRERFSEADSADLRTPEWVDVEFPRAAAGRAGVVIECRQTLLTTYLLYQTLAYMGSEAGRWLADIERGKIVVEDGFISDYLGCIDVQVADGSGAFVDVGSVCEYGPIASDTHVIALGDALRGATRVRLIMTKGNWRVDHVALAALEGQVEPVRVRPSMVRREGRADSGALDALLDSTRVLITLPGDRCTLDFRLPGSGEYDLFLDAHGYYLE
jgi:hypothetical protein